MHIEQLYTNCLAQAAYYIESDGEIAIIDPIRDYDGYIQKAEEAGHKIRYIIETHFHADFVSGHVDLAKKTGAEIIYGPGAQTGYGIRNVEDGEVLPLGNVSLRAIHTPGHTPESTCFLLKDEQGKDHALFSGDTLFVGDVGRPDLLESGGKYTGEMLAGMMYDSLRNKIMPLPDEVLLYPAHGAGSSCGKNLGPETFSTIGDQKKNNYALQDMSRDEFIKALLEGIAPPPSYFAENARINKTGYTALNEVLNEGTIALNAEQFESSMNEGSLVIDTRDPLEFEKGFIPGSINIGLNGQYAIWAASLFSLDRKIVLVCDHGKEEESVTRLARVGFDQIKGVLQGGYPAWEQAGKEVDMLVSVDAYELGLDLKHDEKAKVLDVRKVSEYESGHIKGAELYSLDQIQSRIDELDPETDYYLHCAGGYRSVIAASILKASGFHRIKNVWGGYKEIKENHDIPLEGLQVSKPELKA